MLMGVNFSLFSLLLNHISLFIDFLTQSPPTIVITVYLRFLLLTLLYHFLFILK